MPFWGSAGYSATAGSLTDADTLDQLDSDEFLQVDNNLDDVGTAAMARTNLGLATTTEINTGTDATKPMCPDQFQASNRNIRYLVWRVVAQATSLSAAEATILGAMPVPFSGVIQTPIAYVDTEGTTGNATYDIHYGADPAVAATIMSSTKITIATAQNVSTAGGATQPVLTTTAAAVGNFFTFHCDAVQSGTAAKGLTFVIPILET